MNITKETTGDLTALIKIEIGPSDYAEAVEKQISDYKKKATIPGFRPGHVPTGLIKKMYGRAVMADEVNNLISKSLIQYIKDEQLNILGNPIPNLEKNEAIDFDNNDSFTFFFDIGMTPEFTIPLDQDLNIENYSIAVSDEMVEKYILDTRKKLGKKKDTGTLTEIAETTEVEPDLFSETKKDEVPAEPEVELAEMNAEFFDSVYPGLNIQTEEEFVAQVRKDATISFEAETDKLLFNKITETLVKETTMDLPDEFLKRWLAENNEGKYTPEEIEKNYPGFVDSMKWQLIENKIFKENNIAVTDKDIRDYISTNMLRQMNMGDLDPEMQKRYESIIDTFMQNEEQVTRINDRLYNDKMLAFFKANVIVHPKEVSYEEYIEIASAMHQHDHDHDHSNHDHNHDHDHDHHHDHDHDHH